MKNINELIRPTIRDVKPYACARQNASEGVLLDANENPGGEFTRYPDPYAVELKNAYSAFCSVPIRNIFVGNGSDEAIDLLIRIFCEPGKDEVVVLDPTYGMYRVSADINNVKAASVLLTDDFQIDLKRTLNAVNSNTKLIFACSPNNPTGNLLRKEDILELCGKFEGIVVLDEAYIEFAETESLALEAENLMVLRTLSKAWGAAGLRVGFAIASKEIVTVLNKVKPPYNVNRLSQEKAVQIIEVGLRISEILQEKDHVYSQLSNLGLEVFPSDSNFLLFRVPQASDIQTKLQENGVIVRDRSNMPLLDDCLRLTIGNSEENDKFFDKLKKLLKKVAFIDRDGVLLYEPQDDYQIDSLDKYKILPGVIKELKALHDANYSLVMVSNQDGLGTRSFPEKDFLSVQNRMIEDLRAEGIEFDEIFVCPHFAKDNCNCRKPKVGLVKSFLSNNPINYSQSFVIGDRESDMQLAANIGVRGIKSEVNGVFPNPLRS